MFSTFKNLLAVVYRLRWVKTLSWGERVELARRLVAEEHAMPPGIPLPGGALVLDATHRPDWRVFEGVFGVETYAADYRNSVVIDIGAHRGIFSAYALQKDCFAVLAYEPEPANFAFLEHNAQNFSKAGQVVRAYPQAVGSQKGTARFFVYDQSWSHSTMARTDRTAVAELEVELVDFESILETASELAEGHRRIIVKIDAEGIEYDVLLNTPATATALIDELFVETHTYASGEPSMLAERLEACGLYSTKPLPTNEKEHAVLHFVR